MSQVKSSQVKSSQVKSSRNQNIEIMRIFLMLFIVMHHLTINGYGLQNVLTGKSTVLMPNHEMIFFAVINSFFIIGVNVFFLISGYFGIHFKIKRLVSLIFELYFYSIILNLAGIISGVTPVSLHSIKSIVFPFWSYWFIYAYVLVYAASPLINTGLDMLEKKQAKVMFVFFGLIFCIVAFIGDGVVSIHSGYTFLFSVFSYITGRMMSKYQILAPRNGRQGILAWMTASLITAGGAVVFIILGKGSFAWHMFAYNSPFVFLASVFFIWIFIKLPQGSYKWDITKVSSHILAVYLIHSSNDFVGSFRGIPQQILMEKTDNLLILFTFLVVYAILIFSLCILIDMIRMKVTYRMEDYFGNVVMLASRRIME